MQIKFRYADVATNNTRIKYFLLQNCCFISISIFTRVQQRKLRVIIPLSFQVTSSVRIRTYRMLRGDCNQPFNRSGEINTQPRQRAPTCENDRWFRPQTTLQALEGGGGWTCRYTLAFVTLEHLYVLNENQIQKFHQFALN